MVFFKCDGYTQDEVTVNQRITKGLITWWVSARAEISARVQNADFHEKIYWGAKTQSMRMLASFFSLSTGSFQLLCQDWKCLHGFKNRAWIFSPDWNVIHEIATFNLGRFLRTPADVSAQLSNRALRVISLWHRCLWWKIWYLENVLKFLKLIKAWEPWNNTSIKRDIGFFYISLKGLGHAVLGNFVLFC